MPHLIEAVPTSIAAFVGYTVQGPVNVPTQIFSFAEFETSFGPIDRSSSLSYAVAHFFVNGGEEAWITRVIGELVTSQPSAAEIIGTKQSATGLFALDRIDLFNILIVPDRSEPGIHAAMIACARRKRAFALLDLPPEVDTLEEAKTWASINTNLQHANAAAYYPRIRAMDPVQSGQVRGFANSGAIAGIYARVDQQRAVWKAPAGADVVVVGCVGLESALSQAQQGEINPLGLNALRNFTPHGIVVWGARTLAGADALGSDWKYVPVRRFSLFVEESLYRGLQWVASEPNDEPVWAEIRVSVGAFMHGLFRQGAFQGRSPYEAYAVKCDGSTTTQTDINAGLLNVKVGFAPLKPAEFVWLHIEIAMTS